MNTFGYVKLFRTGPNSSLNRIPPMARFVFYELIRNAEWRDYETKVGREKVQLKRGQILVAYQRWADDVIGTSRSNIVFWLKCLVGEEMITLDARRGWAVVSITNFFKYQAMLTDIALTDDLQVTDNLLPIKEFSEDALSDYTYLSILDELDSTQELTVISDASHLQPTDIALNSTNNISKNNTKNNLCDETSAEAPSPEQGSFTGIDKVSESAPRQAPIQTEAKPKRRVPDVSIQATLALWWWCRVTAINHCQVDPILIPHDPSPKQIGLLKQNLNHYGQGDYRKGLCMMAVAFLEICERYSEALEVGNPSTLEFRFPLISKFNRERLSSHMAGKAKRVDQFLQTLPELLKFFDESRIKSLNAQVFNSGEVSQ